MNERLWNEWKYRREILHKTLFRWAWTILGLAVILPWINAEVFQLDGSNGWRFYSGYWIILALLLCGSSLYLAREYAALVAMERTLRSQESPDGPRLPVRLTDAVRSPRVVIVTVTYFGILVLFVLWVGLLYQHSRTKNRAASLIPSPSRGSAALPPSDSPIKAAKEPSRYGGTLATASGVASRANMDDFHGCGLDGSAATPNLKKLNQLKNRYTLPQSNQIDHSITLSTILAPGDDKTRWNSSSAAELTGFVLAVKPGGKETCNCGTTDTLLSDVHIELVLNSTETAGTKSMVIEVTPRIRAIMAVNGIDWSTKALRKQIRGQWVKVEGWMTFDAQHANAAENTHPGGGHNWRATAWEIHPVTDIHVVQAPQ